MIYKNLNVYTGIFERGRKRVRYPWCCNQIDTESSNPLFYPYFVVTTSDCIICSVLTYFKCFVCTPFQLQPFILKYNSTLCKEVQVDPIS